MPETQLTSTKAKFTKLLAEIASLVCLLIALMLFFALLSYNSQDTSWNNPAEGEPTNLMGVTGAWSADILLALNGFAAWILPLSLVFLAWGIFKRPWLSLNWQPFTPSLRLVGWLLILSCLSIGFSLAQIKSGLVFGTGGVLGSELSQLLQTVLGKLGASLVVVLGLFVGISLFTGWSWLIIMDELGFSLTTRLPRLYNLFINKLAQLIPARKKPLAVKSPDLITPVISSAISPEIKGLAKQEPVLDLTSSQEFNLAASSTSAGSQPGLEVLDALLPKQEVQTPEELTEVGGLLETKLAEFGVEAKVVASHPGPVVTQFELELAAGIKSSKVSGLALDLARNLKVASLRVVEVLPGKSTLGIEVPNAKRQLIQLKEVLDSPEFLHTKNPLPLALGHSISGQPVIANLAKMPHLLVAGTTGSGKSVGINSMLVSLLLHNSPEKLRLIMIDPKMLELSVYEGIPHLLAPVVTDMQEAANSLRWCVAEMEKRYRLMAALGVRNLSGYNALIEASLAKGEEIKNPVEIAGGNPQPSTLETLPYVVVVIDEFADMIMLVGKKVEELIARLAQKARAAGIHLILATQRPSVDVITGLIKANIPTRLAFQVSSRIDSRTILDQGGAEQLLGNGDCLFLPTGAPQPSRLHGAFVADAEVHRLVAAWKEFGQPEYEQSILNGEVEAQALTGLEADKPASAEDAEQDEFYDLAVAFVMETRRASTSSIQRRFKIGYNRAANIIEAMQAAGLVSAPQTNGQRQVLVENHL